MSLVYITNFLCSVFPHMLDCKSDLQKFVGVLRIYGTKVILIEGNAKCYILKLTCEGTLRQVFVCLRPRTPYPLTHCTLYVYTVYLFTQGRGGRVEPERRLEGQQFTKLGRKYQYDCLYPHSINSDKHL
jgi:hypothetical protein